MTVKDTASLPEPGVSGTIGSRSPHVRHPLGTLCAAFGVVSAASLVWLRALTLPDLNPPNWVRIRGVVWLPIGVAGSVVTGVLARHGLGRIGVLIGLFSAAFAVIGFIVLISTAG